MFWQLSIQLNDVGKPISRWKGGQALEEAAQGSGAITIPGRVQKVCIRHLGTWFSAGHSGTGLRAGIGAFEVFFQS